MTPLAVTPAQEVHSGMFKVTATAAGQIVQSAQQGGTEGLALRLAAYQAADGTIDYRMGFDEVGEDDIRQRCEGVEVVMAPEFAPLLDEATLDFVELEPGQHRFIFINPRDSGYVPPQGGADAAA
jgi:iron-sulfur cluster assembly protein